MRTELAAATLGTAARRRSPRFAAPLYTLRSAAPPRLTSTPGKFEQIAHGRAPRAPRSPRDATAEEGDGDFLRLDQGASVGADWHRKEWLTGENR